jgi:hypothetical protein
MANSFLDKFRSGLKGVQSRQLLILLSKEKERGNITTLEEFKQRLQDLTAQLTSSTLTPTLQLFLAKIGDRIDSESFNFMLERIEDDLGAAFQEANDIDEVIAAHETIINDVVIKNLELAINDLESKVESLEFLNKTSAGFDNAVFNTFRITQNARSSFDEGVLFTDTKTGLQSVPSSEAFIDFLGEKLLLRSELDTPVRISSIRQVFDSQARASELPVQFRNSNINNIIDSTIGTFWLQSVLLSKQQAENGVFTKLELDLGAVRTINFVEIEPVLLAPVDLFKISYLDENNQAIDLLTIPVEIKTTNKLFFSSIATRKLFLTFRNRNFFNSQFEIKPDSPLVSIVRDPTNSSQLIEAIKPELQEIVSSPRTRAILGLNTTTNKPQRKYYEYFIGFDSIKVGLNKFEETSIFVSKTEKIRSCGQAAVKTFERRPFSDTADAVDIEYTSDTQPLSFDTYFHGSLEYYLIKRDFTEAAALINSTVLPILPQNMLQIRHERLILNKKSNASLSTNDIGLLQHYTDESILEIKVYRNGEELTPTDLVSINPLETDGWLINTANTLHDPKQTKPMTIAVQIQRPNPNDLYTVSYTPARSTSIIVPQNLTTSAAKIIDLTGFLDSWIGKDNTVYFAEKKAGIPIDYSLLNLVIVLRRNSANVTLTPVVEEYLLATGTKDPRKFTE